MNNKIKKYIPFTEWIIEVAEEKILEHKLIKKIFNSHEEFIIFTIIWMRVYKKLFQSLKEDNSNLSFDKYIKKFYLNQNDKYLGITINAISRESEIPRSTVKRIVERLIIENIVSRNMNRLIIPTPKVRNLMKGYRKFTYVSNKKLFNIFNNSNIMDKYNENDNF